MNKDALKVVGTMLDRARTGGRTAAPLIPSGAAVEAFQLLIQAQQDYRKIKEQEKTNRAAIRARKEVQLTRLREQAAIIREYLELSFAERKHTLEQLFRTLDEAIAADKPEAMQLALTGIIELARQSPLCDAIAAARAATEAVYQVAEIACSVTKKYAQVVDFTLAGFKF
jgi:hypothetical protein